MIVNPGNPGKRDVSGRNGERRTGAGGCQLGGCSRIGKRGRAWIFEMAVRMQTEIQRGAHGSS